MFWIPPSTFVQITPGRLYDISTFAILGLLCQKSYVSMKTLCALRTYFVDESNLRFGIVTIVAKKIWISSECVL